MVLFEFLETESCATIEAGRLEALEALDIGASETVDTLVVVTDNC
jgi:hypothetical protein